MFSVLLGGHVLRLHGRLHALPSQLAWKALALVSSWTSLLLHSLEQRLSLRLNILHHDSFASGAGGAVCVSPFVLHFYGNVRVLKPIALSALCRVQGHWLRQNPKFFPLASDLLVPSSVPCSPLCVLIDLTVMPCGARKEPNLWDAVLPLKESLLKKIVLWKSILIISFLGGGRWPEGSFLIWRSSFPHPATLNKSFNFVCTPVVSL